MEILFKNVFLTFFRSIDYSSNIRLNPDGKISGILGDIKSFAEIDKSLGSPVLSPLFASKIEFAESSDEKYAYRHNQGACVHADEYTCFSGSQKTDILERKQYFSQIEDAKEASSTERNKVNYVRYPGNLCTKKA